MSFDRVTARGRARALAVLFAGLIAGACAAAGAAEGLSEADRAAIAAARVTAETAANSGQTDGWANAYADDAVMLSPNMPPVSGKAAIGEAIKAFPPLSNVKFTHVTVEGAGEWAWVHGTYEMTMTIPGSAPMTDKGKYIEIWRKQADGGWKLHRDIYNSDLPLPAAP